MSQPDQPTPDHPVIERHTELDIDVTEVWPLISTADGWSSWLVDGADITVVPGAHGRVTDDGVERVVRIDSVTEGRGVGFSWWERDDPSSVSSVRLEIVEMHDGRSHLHIAEQFVGSTVATASRSTGVTWDVRLVSLWLLALPCLAMV